MSDFLSIKRKILFDALEKFPDAGNRTIAKILYRDNPLLFNSIEDARKQILYYRGASGDTKRKQLKTKKYVRKQIQSTGEF